MMMMTRCWAKKPDTHCDDYSPDLSQNCGKACSWNFFETGNFQNGQVHYSSSSLTYLTSLLIDWFLLHCLFHGQTRPQSLSDPDGVCEDGEGWACSGEILSKLNLWIVNRQPRIPCSAQHALCAVWFPYSRTSRDISYTLSYPLKIFVPTCSVGSKTWLLRKRDFQILNLRFLGFFRVPKIMFLVTENKQRDKFSSSKDPSKEHRKNNLKKCSPRVFRITPTDFVNDIWCLMHATAQANPRTTISSK